MFSFFTSLNLRVSPQLHNNHVQHNYRPQTKFAKVVFTGVCLSTGGGLCPHGVGGVSVQGRGLCPGEGSLSRGGVSVQGRGFCPGERSLSRGGVSVQGRSFCPGERSLSREGVSVWGRGLCPGRGSLSGGSLSEGDQKLFSFFTSLNLRVSPQLHNNHVQHNYRPQTKFAKVVFTGVCLSTGGVSVHMVWGGLCQGGLCPRESLSRGGVSVQGRGLCVQGRGLCPGEGSLSRGGVSVQGRGLCLGDLCRGDRKLFSFFTSLNLRVSPQLHNNHVQHNYHPRTKFAKVVFTGVCLSTGGGLCPHGVGGLCRGGLCPRESLTRRVSVQGRGLCPGEGSLCPEEGSLSRGGVSVQGRGLCPGEGFLSRGEVSVQGGGLCLGDLCRGGGSLSRGTPVRLCAGGTHPTGMHSCLYLPFTSAVHILRQAVMHI